MKNAIKYLVLGISCVICFVVLVLMVALLGDIGNLSYPATLILPMLSYSMLIGGLVVLTIWAFKFSNNKAHKTFLIISISLLIASTLFYVSAKIVNPIISAEDVPESFSSTTPEKETFDFTPAEITDELKTNRLIDFTALDIVENKEKAEKIATFSSITDIFNSDEGNIDAMIHYQFNYDDTTYKVSYLSIFMYRNSTAAAERYLYHIYSIARCLDPNTNTDEITTAIENGFNDNDFAIYKGKNFELKASRSKEYFNASFTPIKN